MMLQLSPAAECNHKVGCKGVFVKGRSELRKKNRLELGKNLDCKKVLCKYRWQPVIINCFGCSRQIHAKKRSGISYFKKFEWKKLKLY